MYVEQYNEFWIFRGKSKLGICPGSEKDIIGFGFSSERGSFKVGLSS
jgi:hypothetical protein